MNAYVPIQPWLVLGRQSLLKTRDVSGTDRGAKTVKKESEDLIRESRPAGPLVLLAHSLTIAFNDWLAFGTSTPFASFATSPTPDSYFQSSRANAGSNCTDGRTASFVVDQPMKRSLIIFTAYQICTKSTLHACTKSHPPKPAGDSQTQRHRYAVVPSLTWLLFVPNKQDQD
jgi:hypothetical protein